MSFRILFATTVLALSVCSGILGSPVVEPERIQWEGPPPTSLPTALLTLDMPAPTGSNDAQSAPAVLYAQAWDAYERQDFDEASERVALAAATEPEVVDAYNAACMLSLAGRVEGAAWWLQRAILGDGVDVDHAYRDADLRMLRRSPHWTSLATMMVHADAYWSHSGHTAHKVRMPQGYQGRTIPALVWLHGLGANPGSLHDEMRWSGEKLGFATVSVSATLPRGERSFAWSEDVDRDAGHIRAALQTASASTGVEFDPIVLLGFSQGGHLASALLLRQDPPVQGAIVVSPGWRGSAHLEPRPLGEGHGAIVVVGDGESSVNRDMAISDADALRRAGVDVTLRVTQNQPRHAFPGDFAQRFEEWWTALVPPEED